MPRCVVLLCSLGDGLALSMCDQFHNEECTSQHHDVSASRHDTHSWALPVGYYALTLYKFRVADAATVSSMR